MLPQPPEEGAAANQSLITGLQEIEDMWQSVCKRQRHRDIDEELPIPTMDSYFSFTIPSVNAQINTLVGAIHGFPVSWTPPIDILGKQLIVTVGAPNPHLPNSRSPLCITRPSQELHWLISLQAQAKSEGFQELLTQEDYQQQRKERQEDQSPKN